MKAEELKGKSPDQLKDELLSQQVFEGYEKLHILKYHSFYSHQLS